MSQTARTLAELHPCTYSGTIRGALTKLYVIEGQPGVFICNQPWSAERSEALPDNHYLGVLNGRSYAFERLLASDNVINGDVSVNHRPHSAATLASVKTGLAQAARGEFVEVPPDLEADEALVRASEAG